MLRVSSNPHVRSGVTTSWIMLSVIIALLPALGFGIYNFGIYALILTLVCIASCVLTELFFELITKRPVTIGDYSAVVTGLLLGLNLPPKAPWWIGVLGGVFAILVVKMLFGGFYSLIIILRIQDVTINGNSLKKPLVFTNSA